MNLQSFLNSYLNFVSRFLPKSRPKTVIGFDIGTSSVKAIEIGYSGDSLEILNWGLEPIDGMDAKAALKQLLTRMNFKDQIPVTAVSGKGTLIRYVDMPRMPIDELRKSFVYEIDKYFPFDPQTIYTDCYVIDPQSKEKKVSVLVVAAKKELVDERIKLFKDAGVDLTYVTTNAIATANAFGRLIKDQKNEGARAILDIGGSVSNLMILDKSNSPSFTRDIFFGSHDLTKQIANTLGVTVEQANELKRNPGDKLAEVTQACETTLDNLISEIHLSLDYFMTEKNSHVNELFLVGGGSLFKGMEETFAKTLNITVKVWNPLDGLSLSSQVSANDINAYASQLGVAIGLALTKV